MAHGAEIPAETPVSKAMSKELKRRGFRFVGPTICYAFMQAAGLVDDHVVTCFRHRVVLPLAEEHVRRYLALPIDRHAAAAASASSPSLIV